MDDNALLSAIGIAPAEDAGETTAAADAELDTAESFEEGLALADDVLDEDGSPVEFDEEGEPDDVASELEQLRAERDRAAAILQQQQRQQQEAYAWQYWEGTRQQADAYFQNAAQAIYREAENAYDAPAFIRQRMSALESERQNWYGKYHQSREQALRNQTERMAVPMYARAVAEQLSLSDEDAARLAQFPPNMIPSVASIMAERSTQNAKSKAARSLSQAGISPGSGGRGGRRVKAGSDAHLAALFRQGTRG